MITLLYHVQELTKDQVEHLIERSSIFSSFLVLPAPEGAYIILPNATGFTISNLKNFIYNDYKVELTTPLLYL